LSHRNFYSLPVASNDGFVFIIRRIQPSVVVVEFSFFSAHFLDHLAIFFFFFFLSFLFYKHSSYWVERAKTRDNPGFAKIANSYVILKTLFDALKDTRTLIFTPKRIKTGSRNKICRSNTNKSNNMYDIIISHEYYLDQHIIRTSLALKHQTNHWQFREGSSAFAELSLVS